MEMNAHAQAFQISVVLCFAAPRSLISQMAACFQMSLLNPRPELGVGDLSHTWIDVSPVFSPCLVIFCALVFLNGSIFFKDLAWATPTFNISYFFCHHLLPPPCSLTLSLHCPPLLPAVPPPIVHCGNWVRTMALESLCNPHFISTLIEV